MNDIFSLLSEKILYLEKSSPVFVGINGVDGSGKTSFTKHLVEYLRTKTNREIISVTVDGFHNPRSVRYEKGRDSAEGFYNDSYNIKGMEEILLKPLSPGGNRRYRTRIFDIKKDIHVTEKERKAQESAILIVEGIFLFRKELLSYWDYKIFLDVPFDVTLERMLTRDSSLFSSENEERILFEKRYMPGQNLYLKEAAPQKNSDIIIDNSDFNNPKITNLN